MLLKWNPAVGGRAARRGSILGLEPERMKEQIIVPTGMGLKSSGIEGASCKTLLGCSLLTLFKLLIDVEFQYVMNAGLDKAWMGETRYHF